MLVYSFWTVTTCALSLGQAGSGCGLMSGLLSPASRDGDAWPQPDQPDDEHVQPRAAGASTGGCGSNGGGAFGLAARGWIVDYNPFEAFSEVFDTAWAHPPVIGATFARHLGLNRLLVVGKNASHHNIARRIRSAVLDRIPFGEHVRVVVDELTMLR